MAGDLSLVIARSRFCRALLPYPLVTAQTHRQRTLGGRCVLCRYPGTNPWLLQHLCLPILFRHGSLAVSVESGSDCFGECNSNALSGVSRHVRGVTLGFILAVLALL